MAMTVWPVDIQLVLRKVTVIRVVAANSPLADRRRAAGFGSAAARPLAYVGRMNPDDKKLALRAINYGLHVLTATNGDDYAASGANWLSQASFEPPLVMAGIKADSGAAVVIGEAGTFAVNVLAADQLDIGKAFFRSTTVEGTTINGQEFEPGPVTGAPLILATPYWFECKVTDTIARGDHTIFVAEVVNAGVRDAEATPLLLRDTGMNYGG